MAIGNAEYGVPARTTDGKLTLFETAQITAADQYALPVRATDGGLALVRVTPAEGDAQLGVPARTSDGQIAALFLADGTFISCNSCNPQLDATYTVTLTGVAGDLVDIDGAYTVTWVSHCLWQFDDGNILISLIWVTAVTTAWQVSIGHIGVANCHKSWETPDGTSDDCDPTADTFAETSCEDSGCDDVDTCEDSITATCVVT